MMTLYKTIEECVSIDLNFFNTKGKLVVNKKTAIMWYGSLVP